jgi:glycosyltransferase involved in cell wall biosynthesis
MRDVVAMIPGLISTLTTVRNGAAFLREAVDSLLAQTDDHYEVIVIDDGSTDGTAKILADYSDPRLVVATLPPVGRVPALLHAVGLARGEFCALLDADDVALRQRLAVQRAYLEDHPEVALVGARAVEFDGVSEWTRPAPTGPQAVRRALGMYNPFYCSSLAFRRSVYDEIGGFRVEDGWGHDSAFLVRVAAAHPVDIIPEPLIRYRRHSAQITRSLLWEREQRQRSAWLRVRAAWTLNLPPHLWVFPVMAWLYALLPCSLRPRRCKDAVKGWLLRTFATGATAENGSAASSASTRPLASGRTALP